MSASAQHQRGDARSVQLTIDSTKACNVGDAIGVSAGAAVLASEETWVTDVHITRRNFAKKFVGCSAQAKDADEDIVGNGDANALKLRVDCGGVIRVAVADDDYVIGDMIGPKKATGNNLEDDLYELVTDEREATHKVAGREGTDPGYVDAEILSRVMSPAPPTSDVMELTFPIDLVGITNADVLTNYTPGFDGDIIGFDFVVNKPVTTGSKTAALNLEIGTTDVTGGVLTITSAAATPLGKVISATDITADNSFTATDTISIEATAVTAFVEGTGSLRLKVRRRSG